jgi:hypothetical protein
MDTTDSWLFRKEINAGHLLTTVALTFGLISWASTMDSRVTRLETQQEATSIALTRAIDVIDARLNRIEDKLDRVIRHE